GLRLGRRGGLLDRGRCLDFGVLQLVLVPLAPVAAAPARTAVPSAAPPVLVAGGRTSPAPGRLDLVLPVVELAELHEPARGGLGEELAELAEAQRALVEGSVDLLHDLLQAVRAHHVVPRDHL